MTDRAMDIEDRRLMREVGMHRTRWTWVGTNLDAEGLHPNTDAAMLDDTLGYTCGLSIPLTARPKRGPLQANEEWYGEVDSRGRRYDRRRQRIRCSHFGSPQFIIGRIKKGRFIRHEITVNGVQVGYYRRTTVDVVRCEACYEIWGSVV